jgi:predicted transglutaminase-like cysteine proteinase
MFFSQRGDKNMEIKFPAKGLLTAAVMALMTSGAFAAPANMIILNRTNPPIGHYEFCKQYQDQCEANPGSDAPLALTQANWKALLKINYKVNSAIEPETDMQVYGVEEKWAYPTTAGDCEDYALLKRKLLMQIGFSPSDLLITVVLQPNGDGHAVLTVRTDHGDFILDNMRNKVLLWSDTEYTYLKRQSNENSGEWVKIEDDHSPAVGSLQ